MNVEHLHRVARLTLDELAENDTREHVLRLRNGLEAVAVNATDSQAQQVLSEARTHLQRTLPTVPSNGWPPSDRDLLDEIGISNVIGQTLLSRIEDALAQNQMTPSIALEEIDRSASDSTRECGTSPAWCGASSSSGSAEKRPSGTTRFART